MGPPRLWIIGSLAAAGLAACATFQSYSSSLERMLAADDISGALTAVKQEQTKSGGSKNALLYALDRGMLLHLDGKYQESNQAFEDAKRLADDLLTKSLSKGAASFLTNDMTLPYSGEDFERAQINIFCAMNYILLGKNEDALVEARQVDFYLKRLQTTLGRKNAYREDAFARYLTGMIYENEGAVNDAFVSYYQALEAYDRYKKYYGVAAPEGLVGDALRTAAAMGFQDQVDLIKGKWGTPAPGLRAAVKTGEVVILHYNGLAPHKTDTFIQVSVKDGWVQVQAFEAEGEEAEKVQKAEAVVRSLAADKFFRVAFPKYRATPYTVRGLTAHVDGSTVACRDQVAQDIGAIAQRDLADRISRVRAKAVARAAIKYLMAQKIGDAVEKKKGDQTGDLIRGILSTAASLTEEADKRAWETVPDKIQMSRLTLAEGPHKLELSFTDEAGREVTKRNIENVAVTAGRKTFLVVRTAR